MRRLSLRTRLLAALLGLVAAGMLVAGAVTYGVLRDFLLERVDAQLLEARAEVGRALVQGTDGTPPVPGGPGSPDLPPGTYGELRDTSGTTMNRVAFAYSDQAVAVPELPDPLPGAGSATGRPTFFTADSSGSGRFRVLVQPAPATGSILVVAIPYTETQATLSRLLGVEVVVFVLVLAGLGIAAWLLIKRDLKPLETMAETADAIAAGDLSQRVEPAEPQTEVGRLGLSLNAMLAQIERAFAERTASEEKLRRFVADASHELRTPLTSIRGYAEIFERAKDDPDDMATAMRRIEEESRRMGVMVDELLLLARLGAEREPERAPVDMARVVADALSDARATGAAHPIDVDAPDAVTVTGDEHQLRQVVANLVGNALRHTPDGTPVRVRLADGGGRAVLVVADEGPGLEPEAAARVFEPFYRADSSRTRETGGAGLGLAIVAAIVAAHGGEVALDTAPGAGATFTVRLPLAGA